MTVEVREAKQLLRERTLSARRTLTSADLAAAGVAVAAHGTQAWGAAATVAAYLAFGTEPPTAALLDRLRDSGARVLLPVITAETLDWAPYDGPHALRPGPLGSSEPTGPRLGPAALGDAAVVLVPALAVDRHGNRLGRGRGYYDRSLAAVTAPVVAVVYDHELIDEVPTERHDRKVAAVLRPAGLTTLGG